ncbi:MAG: hypothetical protein LUF87_04815 [Alistipes sp.]|nr:hypothetical protein [Alistipes sp.]
MDHIPKACIITGCLFLALSCACNRPGDISSGREFYSGTLVIAEYGRASFTDCATRVTTGFDTGGAYEKLREVYTREAIPEGVPVRIEFYGEVSVPLNAAQDPTIPVDQREIRIDSLLVISRDGRCLSDHTVPGLYRKLHDGEAEILRLRPDYSYSKERFMDGGSEPVEQGRWYRTSELTLDLADNDTGRITPYQIVPEQESITGTGGGEPDVYKKEWL